MEMTFSFGNRFIGNRLVGNAICGVWGGYSQDTLIAGNTIEENGALGYGLERGGVNIEHGRGNRIIHNTFRSNRCGVHLWWDPDEDLGRKPWAKANGTASTGNLVAANRFEADDLVFHFRGPSDVTIGANTIRDAKRQMEKEPESEIARTEDPAVEPPPPAEVTIRGESRPVGARSRLHGRASIIMTEWGPWDHETPLVRLVERKGGLHLYDLHRLPEGAEVEVRGDRVQGARGAPAKPGGAPRYAVMAEGAGVFPYTIVASGGGFRAELKGTIVSMVWDATFFSWPEEIDPREQPAEWHALAKGEAAVSERVSRLAFKYASGGPGDLGLSEALTGAGLGGDRFGMIARTRLP
ncbi:MAG: right-handed parallel beta-helix repeat-containing protein, partial [Planctomycetota bacterium]